jgi:hypothetical protein
VREGIPLESRTDCKPHANYRLFGSEKVVLRGELTGETPCAVREVYGREVNRECEPVAGRGPEEGRGWLPRGDDNLDVLLKYSTDNLQEIQRMVDTLLEV